MATIKLTNDVLLSSNSVQMFIDPTNVLVDTRISNTSTSDYKYTATQDCFVIETGSSGPRQINGVNIPCSNWNMDRVWLCLRKGDTLSAPVNNDHGFKAFGLK